MALPHVKHVFRCTVLKLVHIWWFTLSKGLLTCYFQICILRKMCEGIALCMTSQSWAILSVRTLGVDTGQQDLKREWKWERKRWKERKQKDPVLLMLAFLLASGIRVGKGRAFSPVRVTERWLSTFSLTPALCACVWQGRLSKDQRCGNTLLSRNQSLEEEYERAKAAVEVSQKSPLNISVSIKNLMGRLFLLTNSTHHYSDMFYLV